MQVVLRAFAKSRLELSMGAPAGVRRTAIHEAAHAVVALKCGIGVKELRIGTVLETQAETVLDLPDDDRGQ